MDDSRIKDLRRNLRRIERGVERQLRTETSCCGVSLAQCHALLELEDLGQASLAALASALGLDCSTTCRTVDALVRAGLADRTEDRQNRRRVLLSLSGKGKKKAGEINGICDGFYSRMAGSMSKRQGNVLLEGTRLLAGLFDRGQESCCPKKA